MFKRIIISTLAVTGLALGSFGVAYFYSPTTDAVSNMKNFDAGNIISDAMFYDGNSLSAGQIQSFLNGKVPKCDTQGSQPYGRSGKTVKEFWTARGEPAPYTCLKDWKQKTPTVTGESGICSYLKGYNSRTAAQIISDVGKACGISPKVLLVLLQKEQSLVTDNSPLRGVQYGSATGMGCPDTAGCDPKYDGFFNQVYGAARQYKLYRAAPKNYNYVAGRNNYIQYSPDASCGGSRVYIKNQATAGLYNYTPYQPNKATKNAPLGATVHCGAYGNKNFWYQFNNWFGSTIKEDVVSNARFERLAGTSPAVILSDNGSLANYTKTVSLGNKINTFHYNTSQKSLQLTQWNGSRWTTSTIDGSGAQSPGAKNNDIGKGIDAFVYGSEIQVYYYDATEKSIRHAWSSNGGSRWKTETLEGSAGALSGYRGSVGRYVKAFQYGSSGIQIFYLDEVRGSIRHAWWDVKKQRWGFEDFDGVKGSIGKSTHTVGYQIEGMVWDGHGIQLYYYDSTLKGIRHAWWDAKTQRWRFENFDGVRGSVLNNTNDVGSSISLTVYNKDLQLFYFDRTAGELRHAWWKSNQRRWGNEKFDGATNSVIKNVINAGQQVRATTYQSGLYVFYYDNASSFESERTSGWRLAYWQGGQWNERMYDGGNSSVSVSSSPVAGDLSLTTHNKGRQLQIFYQDATGGLRHSWITK